MLIDAAFPASRPQCSVALVPAAHGLLAPRNINTSLSGKLFFLMCWCIRDAVHLDSRVHAAKYSHLTILEGNMAKKAKKAKKAKSAVKKTAKKTKKVAKKKK
jgi:hypothetical protein